MLKLQMYLVLSYILKEPTIFSKEPYVKSTSRKLADLKLLKLCSTEDCEIFAVHESWNEARLGTTQISYFKFCF